MDAVSNGSWGEGVLLSTASPGFSDEDGLLAAVFAGFSDEDVLLNAVTPDICDDDVVQHWSSDGAVSCSATALPANGAVAGTGRTAETGADSLDVIATADAFAVC